MHGIKRAVLPLCREKAADYCVFLFSLLVIVLTVLPFFMLCCYNHPGDTDNWWIFRSFLARKGLEVSFYSLFSMRGTFNFVNLFFLPLYNHPEGMTKELFSSFLMIYHVSAAFYVLLFWISTSSFYCALNKTFFHFQGCHALFFYALYLYLVFNAIHYPTMAFYDLVSSSGYNAGLSYLFFFCAFAVLHYGAVHRKRTLYGILCFLLFGACIFSMEYYPFICGCIAFAFILYDLCTKHRINILHLIFLVICLGVFFRNFLLVRTLVTPDADGFVGKYTGGSNSGLTMAVTISTMMQSLKENSIRYFRQLLTQRRYLPSVAMLVTGVAVTFHKRGVKLPLWGVLPFFVIIAGICAIFSFSTPDLFVMPRYAWTPYVLMCLFILAFLISLVLLLLHAFDRELSLDQTGDFQRVREGCSAAIRIFREKTKNGKFLVGCTAVCMLLFTWCALKNSNSCVACAWKDLLKGDAAAFNREMTDRYTAIFSAEKGEAVYLVPIVHRPTSLFVRDSMEFEVDRITYRSFFDKSEIYFKIGDLILR